MQSQVQCMYCIWKDAYTHKYPSKHVECQGMTDKNDKGFLVCINASFGQEGISCTLFYKRRASANHSQQDLSTIYTLPLPTNSDWVKERMDPRVPPGHEHQEPLLLLLLPLPLLKKLTLIWKTFSIAISFFPLLLPPRSRKRKKKSSAKTTSNKSFRGRCLKPLWATLPAAKPLNSVHVYARTDGRTDGRMSWLSSWGQAKSNWAQTTSEQALRQTSLAHIAHLAVMTVKTRQWTRGRAKPGY